MAKQPPKRPRAAGKSLKTAGEQPQTSESPDRASSSVDRIPPEVYPAPPAPISTPPAPVVAPEPAQSSAAPAAEAPPAVATPAAASKPAPRGGFLPLVLGGLVAGAVGFAVANLTNTPVRSDLDQLLAAQDARITALQQELAGQVPVDLDPVAQAQDDLATRLADLQAELGALRADLDSRISSVPQAGGAGVSPNISAFEAEMAALRSQLNEMTDIARTELDAARAEAASIEENAAAAAANAAARAVVARLQVSVETGAPLGSVLNDLQNAVGDQVPDTLLAAQDGVPTLAALQESFPEYARAALTSARAEGVSGEDSTGIGAFLRNQFAVRSVNPREGDTADAILSRAQAAVRAGRIADALSEIYALPDVARAGMADWTLLAETRVDVVAAIDSLATSLRDN